MSETVKIIGVHDLPSKFIALYGDGSGGSVLKRAKMMTLYHFKEPENDKR